MLPNQALSTQPPVAYTLPAGEEPEFGYGQLFSVLLRRFVWVGGAIAGTVGIATYLTIKADPVYQSSMQLLIEPNYRQTVDITGQQAVSSSSSQVDYATQINLMRSDTFVTQAIENLKERNPNFCGPAVEAPQCLRQYQGALSLNQIEENDTETRIFQANFTANDPAFVQAFLTSLGEVYISYNEAQQEQRLEEGLALVNQQIEGARDNLDGSRQALRQFREAERVVNPEQQALALSNTLRELENSEIELSNQILNIRAEYNALQAQLNADPESALISSRLSQSSRYQQLLNALQEIELALAQRLSLYAEADPGVQDLMSQRQNRVQLLQEEVLRVLGDSSGQVNLNEAELLTRGQLGGIDLNLVNELVQAQVNLQGLEARQVGLEQARQRLQSEYDNFPDLIAEFDSIQPEIGIQQQSLEQLLRIREELSNELAQGGFTWDIVEAPNWGRKIAPQPTRNLMLGIVAGAFIGGALAFGREALDKVVRTSEELKKQVALPLLGVIPEISGRQLEVAPLQMNVEQPSLDVFPLGQRQPFRDAVDLIYKTIQLTNSQSLTSLMVTSAIAGEGKTTLAIGLAVSAARSHQRVLVIDANWRHPTLHQQLGLSNERGLSTQLRTNQIQADQLSVVPVSLGPASASIDVLTSGPVPDDPVRFLSSRQMRRLITLAEASYDLVVVDAPTILGLPDGLELASLCKGVMLVSRLDRITQADLNNAMTMLSQVNAIGMIANGYRGGGSTGSYDRDDAHERLAGVPATTSRVRSLLEWTNPRMQMLAISAFGLGALSVPAIQRALLPDIQRVWEALSRQACIGQVASNCDSPRVSAAPAVSLGSISAQSPRWSNVS